MPRILLLTGLLRDPRIYDRLLPLVPTATIVPWIEPLPRESIRAYAVRLAATLQPESDTIVCGVSFGGIVARELAAVLGAKACVLIASIRQPADLPLSYRRLPLVRWLPLEALLDIGGRLAARCPWLFRPTIRVRLRAFAGPEAAWQRWAAIAVLRWQPTPAVERIPLTQMHGDCDRTLPLGRMPAEVVIRGSGHMLAMAHPEEVAAVLLGRLPVVELEKPH